MIQFEILNTTINRIDSEEMLTTGNVNTKYVQFTFSKEWENLNKNVIFCDITETVYSAALNEENTAVIPEEVLRLPGILEIGVYGTEQSGNENIVRLSSKIAKIYVDKGAFTDKTIEKTINHNALTNRNLENQHTMTAITGLAEWKNEIDTQILGLNSELEKAILDIV